MPLAAIYLTSDLNPAIRNVRWSWYLISRFRKLNLHKGIIVSAGALTRGLLECGGETITFLNDTRPKSSHQIIYEVVQINATLKKRLMRLLEKIEHENHDDNDQSDFQAKIVQNRDQNFQLPLKIGKVCDPPFREFKGKWCSYADGFSLHANTAAATPKSLDRPNARQRIQKWGSL